MAPPSSDLRKIGLEGFALIDKFYGQTTRRSSMEDLASGATKDPTGYFVGVVRRRVPLSSVAKGGAYPRVVFSVGGYCLRNFYKSSPCLEVRLSALDEKGEEEDLSEEELAEFHGVSLDIHSLSRLHASISWQQSRALWLKEGNANSKYFHSVLASRRRRNTMSVIQVDGVTLEGVTPIRQAVFSHFESHFKAPIVERPGVDDLQFKRLN
ncbi:cysteine-rich receptor-like protein kinase [Trifolium pratense]|uniref:Cysteine-rich receptor-like protein kinase n=1 Tax=Trifolium pratense TaxID=57577 RepID=A0A2K3PPP9_TRIPR|nr:cysteine-rich receptor-like protein kinase [Trifolium pratense]